MYAYHVRRCAKFVTCFSAVLLGLFIGSNSFAQDVDLRFRIYVPEQGGILTEDTEWKVLPELFVREGGSYRRIAAARGQASRFFSYRGDAEMMLYTREVKRVAREVENWDPNEALPTREESSYVPYAKVTVPAEWTEAMLLIRPEERNAQGLRWAAIMNLDPRRLPKGKGTFYNASGRPLAMTLAGEAYMLQPGQRLILNASQMKEKEVQNMTVGRMILAERDADSANWRPRYSRPVYLKSNVSNLFLISGDPGERIRVRAIYGEEKGES